MPEEIRVALDPRKLARVAKKSFLFLKRKSKCPVEAYAALLIVKVCLELEFGFTESGFRSVVGSFIGSQPEVSADDMHKLSR